MSPKLLAFGTERFTGNEASCSLLLRIFEAAASEDSDRDDGSMNS